MRLIDADATIPMIKYATTDNEIGIFPIRIGFDDIVKVLNAQPTVEAIPIGWIKERMSNIEDTMLEMAWSMLISDWKEREEE